MSTVAEERRGAPSLSLPLKSRCSVAGKAALSASTLRYVTGGNRHLRTLSISFFLKQSPPFQHSQSNNAIRTLLEYTQEALPLYLLYRSPFSTQKAHYHVKVHFSSLLNAMRIMSPTLTLTPSCTIVSRSCHPNPSKHKLSLCITFFTVLITI